MRQFSATLLSAAAATALIGASVWPANAACTRLGFTVNDYGKDGPTRDAKSLLDKYVAKWAGDHAIANYRTGPKDVKCELFLNFIVFDEHTCTAEATVCWDGAPVTPPVQSAAGSGPAVKTDNTAVAAEKTDKPAKKAMITKPELARAAGIETSAVTAVPKPATPTPAASAAKPVVAQPATADQALAAAQKAADAAERAAAAAERAAAAASAAEKASAGAGAAATAAKP